MRRGLPLALALSAALGCAGAELRGKSKGVRNVTAKARENGAYKCSPRELALAESNLEFTDTELDQGHYLDARDHLAIASENATRAYQNSPPERCAPKVVIAEAKDTDGDGCLDDVDRCPVDPEDKDGFQDDDCCPEPDNDADGVCDPAPEIQATLDKYVGVCLSSDKCPLEPEDKDGFEDEDGCPEPDNDQDGILDVNDQCPLQPEDLDGFQDEDGCPDPDNDQDQILDVVDTCPNEPEDYDGDEDTDGCPDLYKLVKITDDKIEISQKVFFKFNKWDIDPVSFALLDEVALVLQNNPTMQVRVEGHTDSRGNDRANEKLSQKRADSVKTYLGKKGVDGSRLEARGFGESQPIADNRSKIGREQNRRVEFMITSK
ncbi:MAG: OmpA family protein [Myxococcota bacterium]